MANDATRPFIPVSPSFDNGGDAHNWDVWHGLAPLQNYQTEPARFLSEFGLQALPHLDTITTAQAWPTHHADLKKLAHYAALFNEQLTLNNEQIFHPSSLILHPSQLAQATALQTAIEQMRRRKGQAGGVCVWQFNEPWPAISWAIVDYFGRPKLAYQRLKWWYNPVLISLKFPVGQKWQPGDLFIAEIWAINDSLQTLSGCELRVGLSETRPQTADGRGPTQILSDEGVRIAIRTPETIDAFDLEPEEVTIHTQSVDLPANQSHVVGLLTYRFIASPRHLALTLHHNGQLIAQNGYDLNWQDAPRPHLYHRLRRRLAEWLLR
jgi:beta-mannosidase